MAGRRVRARGVKEYDIGAGSFSVGDHVFARWGSEMYPATIQHEEQGNPGEVRYVVKYDDDNSRRIVGLKDIRASSQTPSSPGPKLPAGVLPDVAASQPPSPASPRSPVDLAVIAEGLPSPPSPHLQPSTTQPPRDREAAPLAQQAHNTIGTTSSLAPFPKRKTCTNCGRATCKRRKCRTNTSVVSASSAHVGTAAAAATGTEVRGAVEYMLCCCKHLTRLHLRRARTGIHILPSLLQTVQTVSENYDT